MHHLSTFWYKQDLVAGGGRWWPPWRWLVVAGGGRLVAGGVHLIAWCPLVAGSGVHLVAIWWPLGAGGGPIFCLPGTRTLTLPGGTCTWW